MNWWFHVILDWKRYLREKSMTWDMRSAGWRMAESHFRGMRKLVCRANIFLRTAERVLIEVGRFRATTFEELFQGIKALPWEDYIPVNGKFWVKKASSNQEQAVFSV